MLDAKSKVDRLLEDIQVNNEPKYAFQAIPSQLDEIIDGFISQFMQAPMVERQTIISAISERHSAFLTMFSERMAALAVRESSRNRVLKGLVALVVEDYKDDWRDNIICLGPLYHSTVKIGVDPNELFTEAASYYKNEAAEIIEQFPTRPPEDRSLKAMGFKESNGSDGFKYEMDL